MANTLRIKRRTADATAPSTLASGELAYNEVGGILYYGKGNNGSAVATSIVKLGGESLDASYLTTGTIPAGRMPAFTGDVTTSAGAVATTIAANAVSLAKMAQVATLTLLGRVTAATGNVEALTAAQAKTVLAIAQADVAGLTTASSPTFAGGTLTGELLISYASGRLRVTDGTNTLVMGMWDGSNVRIETSGRPLYVVSYGGAISIGRSSGTNLVIDTSSVSWGSNALLHAGNYASYSTFSGAGTFIGNIAITTDASSGDYSLIAHKYAGVTKAYSGYSGGLAIYGGETGIATRIQAGGQYAITALTNGNVGIGTTSPSYKFQVESALAANATFTTNSNMLAMFKNTTSAVSAWGGIKLQADEGSGIWFSDESGTSMHGYISTRYTGQMDFATGQDSATAATVKMSILTSGNVGIGTTSPGYKLDVAGSAWNNIARIQSSGGSSGIEFYDSGTRRGVVYSDASGFGLLNSATNWALRVNQGTDTLYIPGNVGIGTTSPSAALHVSKAVNADWLAKFVNTGTNPYGLYVDTSANVGSQYTFAAYTNVGTGLLLQNNGLLGIGTATPLGILHVSSATGLTASWISNTAEGVDAKNWAWQMGSAVGSNILRLRAVNDANTTGNNAVEITRSGTTISQVAFPSTTGKVSIASTTAGASNAGALVVTGGGSFGNNGSASYFGGAVSGNRAVSTGVANTNGDISLTINGNSSIGTAARWINQPSSAAYNWQLGTNLSGNWFSFMASTVVDGTTFSTDALKLTNAGAATFASTVTSTQFQSNVYRQQSGDRSLLSFSGVETALGSGTPGDTTKINANGVQALRIEASLTATFAGILIASGGINNTVIGASTPMAGSFTNVTTGEYAVDKALYIGFNNVANEKCDIIIPNDWFWGTFEVTLTSSYNYQNAPGVIAKKFGLGLGPNGSVYVNSARYTEVMGNTADNFAISDLTWDAVNSRYKIQIVHRTATANGAFISIRGLASSSSMIKSIQAGSVYTTDTTVFAYPTVSFPGNIVLTSTAASSSAITGALQVAGGIGVAGASFFGSSETYFQGSTGNTNLISTRAGTSNGATFQYKTGATLKWYHGLRGLVNDNFYIHNQSTDVSVLVLDVATNAATFAGAVTAERYKGTNSLVLNTYATVNPASNVFLYSQSNDRDSWLYLDSADTGSNWGIYHRQIDTSVSGLPANSIGFVGGGSSGLQAWISLVNGSANFAGALTQGGNQVLHAGNYTSYSPSLTGTGASGTWGISVTGSSASCTGNAATATTASNLTTATITGQLLFNNNVTFSGNPATGGCLKFNQNAAVFTPTAFDLGKFFFEGTTLKIVVTGGALKQFAFTDTPLTPSSLNITHTAAQGAAAFILTTSDSASANGSIRWKDNAGNYEAGIGSNFNIGDPGALEFLNGGTTNMILRSSGRLGIGTTAPSQKLEIVESGSYAAMSVGNGTNLSYFGYANVVSNFNTYAQAGDAIVRGTNGVSIAGGNGTAGVRIDSAGNVGIGTASPGSFKLNVNGDFGVTSGNTIALRQDQGIGTYSIHYANIAPRYPIRFVGNSDSGTHRYFEFGYYTGDSQANAWNANVVLDSYNGNVGIGTTSPGAKLDVNGSQILTGDFGFSADQTARLIWGRANGGAIRIRSNSAAASDRNVQFGNADNNGAFSSYMTVAEGGNVGIGTTTPNKKLEVFKDVATNTLGSGEVLRILGDDGNTVGRVTELGFGVGPTGATFASALIGAVNISATGFGTKDLYFATRSSTVDVAPTERMRIATTGTVSISSATAGSSGAGALVVTGGIGVGAASYFGGTVATGALTVTGAITATGNITAYFSDDRLKTRLGPITNALEKIKSLTGFYFEPNQTAQRLGYEKKTDVGVSAQEVQAILPEIIAPAPIDPQYMTVRYEKLIPLLIEAIKAQQRQIEELQLLVQAA